MVGCSLSSPPLSVSNPMKLYLTILAVLLNACGQPMGGDRQDDAGVARDSGVRFFSPWNGEDGMSLFAEIDGTDHLIQDEVRSFTMISAREYAERGIPENAVLAATFLETVDSRLDYQGVYVIRDETGPKIYRGFYVPGLGNEVEWESVKLWFD